MEFNRIGDEVLYAICGLIVATVCVWEAVKWLVCNVTISVGA